MLIGEVAERSGIAAKTLRYYEDIGLLQPPARSASGYRRYESDVLDRLVFIKSAQVLGLSLGEIRSVIALRDDGETPCEHVATLVAAHLDEIDRTIRDLRSIKAELRSLLERAPTLDPAQCDPNRVCHLIGPR